VGPPNSDDVKVVQDPDAVLCAQPRPVEADADRRRHREARRALGEGKADLAIIRGDLDVPKNAQAVATLRRERRRALGTACGQGKKAGPEDHEIQQLAGRRIGVVGRPRPMSICSR